MRRMPSRYSLYTAQFIYHTSKDLFDKKVLLWSKRVLGIIIKIIPYDVNFVVFIYFVIIVNTIFFNIFFFGCCVLIS